MGKLAATAVTPRSSSSSPRNQEALSGGSALVSRVSDTTPKVRSWEVGQRGRGLGAAIEAGAPGNRGGRRIHIQQHGAREAGPQEVSEYAEG